MSRVKWGYDQYLVLLTVPPWKLNPPSRSQDVCLFCFYYLSDSAVAFCSHPWTDFFPLIHDYLSVTLQQMEADWWGVRLAFTSDSADKISWGNIGKHELWFNFWSVGQLHPIPPIRSLLRTTVLFIYLFSTVQLDPINGYLLASECSTWKTEIEHDVTGSWRRLRVLFKDPWESQSHNFLLHPSSHLYCGAMKCAARL